MYVTQVTKDVDYTRVTGGEQGRYIVWYRGEGRTVVAVGNDVFDERLRVSSTGDDVTSVTHWLTIDQTSADDETIYTCQRSGLEAHPIAFRLIVDGGSFGKVEREVN